jgi:excinuclease ABC subunit C
MSVSDKLKKLPTGPGVYLFKDTRGRPIYVGKAKELHSRVRDHFRDQSEDPRHSMMVRQVRDIDYVATGSEIEALILEANLIKQHRPKYNILLKDDKKYPYVKVTTREDFPRLILTRDLVEDGSRYFGPFTDVKALRQGLRLLRSAFKLRGCPGEEPGRIKGRECIDYQIGICSAPCTGKTSKKGYAPLVEELLACLRGQSDRVMEGLRGDMEDASRNRQYERCSELRDRIGAIESALRRQHVFALRDYDSDVVGFGRHEDLAAAVVLKVREGRVLGKDTLLLQGASGKSDLEVLSSVISQYYLKAPLVPSEILVPVELGEEKSVLSSWLSQAAERKVLLRIPQKGRGAALLAMARENALLAIQESTASEGRRPQRIPPLVHDVQVAMGLPSLPVRVEAFDISQLSGGQAVASVVVFENAEPRYSEYRKMRIKGVVGQDDFRMMHEAVARRVSRLLKEEKTLPDFLLVDGGKAQVSAASNALNEADLERLRVIGFAKGKEEFHFSWREGTLELPATSKVFRLLSRIRDEAHRFALGYHRKLRGKETTRSELDTISGIGAVRKKALLRRFGSVDAIKRARPSEIADVPGVGGALAKKILTALGEETGGAERAGRTGARRLRLR